MIQVRGTGCTANLETIELIDSSPPVAPHPHIYIYLEGKILEVHFPSESKVTSFDFSLERFIWDADRSVALD